ncbi:RNA polymerase sigma factor [Bacillus sp. N9]
MLIADEKNAPPSPEEIYLSKESESYFFKRLHKLDDLSKEIVTLRIYGELSFKEIGELVKKSENYARVTFHRAKLKLQKEMRMRG